MAKPVPLNPQQQEALSKIMSVPINPAPTQTYQVPELTPRISTPAEAVDKDKTNGTTPNVTVAPATDEKTVKKNGLPVMIIGVVILVIIGLVGYAFFWLKFFKVI